MSDLFISYASEDREIALKYFNAFCQLGFDVWWDYENMSAGGMVHRDISKALDEAKCIVVLWSKHSVDSNWVNDEAHVAKNDNKLVPVIVDSSITRREIPALLRIIHSANLTEWDGDINSDRFKKLIDDITRITPPSLPAQSNEPQEDNAQTQPQTKEPEKPQSAMPGSDSENIQPVTPPAPPPPAPEAPITPPPLIEQNESAETPLGLLFLLPLLTIAIKFEFVQLDLGLYIIPVAAWLGAKYGNGGMKLAAFSFAPLLYGSPIFSGFSLPIHSGLYFTAVFIAYACAYPNRFWRNIESFNLTIPAIAGIIILSTAAFGFKGPFGHIAIQLDSYLLYTAVFIIGLMGRHIKATILISTALGLTGLWLSSSSLTKFSEDLGNGLKAYGGYRFDSIPEVGTIIIILLGAHLIGKALRGEKIKQGLTGTTGYLLFFACWVYTTLIIQTSKLMVYSGSTLLILAMAFIAGVIWQKKGQYLLMAAIAVSALASLAKLGGNFYSTETLSIYFNVRSLSYVLNYYLAAIAFYIFGVKLSQNLGLSPGLPRALPGKVSEQFEIIPVKTKQPTKPYPALLLLVIPLLPLLTMSYQFSRRTGFSFYYLIVPAAAWLAFRFGKKAFLPICIAMLFYWVGFYVGNISFRLSPDLYLLAVIIAWTIIYPEKWQQTLDKLQVSKALALFLIIIAPMLVTYSFGDFKIGWYPAFFYPFIFFMIGAAGVSHKFAITSTVIAGIVGFLLFNNGVRLRGDVSAYYIYTQFSHVFAALLWLMAGMVMKRFNELYQANTQLAWAGGDHRFTTGAQQPKIMNNLIERVTSRKAFYVFAVLMAVAMFGIKMKLFGVGVKFSGNTWLFFLGAFMAGYIWRQLGFQLTLFGYAVGWLLSGAIIPGSDGSLVIGVENYLALFSDKNTFLITGLASFLYCYMGVKMSHAVTRTTDR